jgi:hypothetical protein
LRRPPSRTSLFASWEQRQVPTEPILAPDFFKESMTLKIVGEYTPIALLSAECQPSQMLVVRSTVLNAFHKFTLNRALLGSTYVSHM